MSEKGNSNVEGFRRRVLHLFVQLQLCIIEIIDLKVKHLIEVEAQFCPNCGM